MGRLHHTEAFARTEDALTVLFCLIDEAYALLNPRAEGYEAIKRLSDSEALTLALLQQLRVSRASARYSGTPSGSSLTCSLGWWAFTPPRCTEGCADSGASWSPSGAPSLRSSWASQRR